MSEPTPFTRRDGLKRIAAAGALVGGGTVGVSSTAADDRDSDDSDRAGGDETGDDDRSDDEDAAGRDTDDGIRLEPECVDAGADGARFRVENDTERTVDLTWAVVDDPAIEFLDCRTVRFVGNFADCMVHVVWWEEGGLVGTIEEPSGPVEGERIVDPVDDLGAPEEAIVASAEVFEEGTAVAPGNGDRSRSHPAYPTCRTNALARLDDPGEAGDTDPPDGPGHDLTVPAARSASFTADAEDGAVTVALFREGERIAVADGAVDQPCEPVVDPADLDLVPICYRPGEKKKDGSWGTPHGKFRVDNHGEATADVAWREDGGDESGSITVPASDSAYFWVDLGAECAATVTLHYGGEQVDVKAANTVKRCQDEQ